MKQIIALTLFLSMLTACGHAAAEFPTTPSATRLPAPGTSRTLAVEQVSIEHTNIIYYDITGSTAGELRESMDRLRPKDPYDGNRPVDVYTDWHIKWNWPGYGTDDCDLSAAVVTYEIKVTLPRWKAPADANPELIARWEQYIQNLVFHEKGHIDNIVNNYLDMKIAIQGATCSTADAAAQKALEPLREFDANYDSQTNHGANQGVVFP